jgi:signal transduction histidine kinase
MAASMIDPAARTRLMGRAAAVLFLCSGAIVLATVPLSGDVNIAGTIAVSVGAISIGVAAWLSPWDRWPWWATLVLVPPALALIAFGNAYGGPDQHAYGVFFVVAFVWIGIAHRPSTSILMAPLAILAFVIPLQYLPNPNLANAYVSGVITIAVCVMVGETLAFGTRRLLRTEEALAEQSETTRRLHELDRMKSTFMSTVSHELRTPLTIVRGHLEILRDDPTPAAVIETTELVLDELDAMARLIDDLGVLARGDDPSSLRPAALDATDVVGDVAHKVKPILDGRLRVEPVPDGAVVTADPVRLRQALLNLLHNAGVHTRPEAPVTLRLVPERHAWRFEVDDEGGGLLPGEEELAFSSFWHGARSSGSGIGLGVVRTIAKAHGGMAGVENRPGEGATFWLTIPR